MPIKNIILHQGRDTRSHVRLEVAATIAAQHEAYIIGVFATASAVDQTQIRWAIGSEGVDRWRASLQEASDKAKAAFDSYLSAKGLSGEWHSMDGADSDVMIAAARHGDLTIVGKTDADEESYDSSLPDHVVLGAGGPVLIVPYAGTFSTVGKRVMIAWNGEREAARALKDSLPFIRGADKVLIYSVVPAGSKSEPSADISAFLARHGVEAELAHSVVGAEADAVHSSLKTVGGFGFQERGAWTYTRHHALAEISTGDALLSAVADHSIDLLVMGAYGHARLRELIFGGVTRHILKTMTVPVLMSN